MREQLFCRRALIFFFVFFCSLSLSFSDLMCGLKISFNKVSPLFLEKFFKNSLFRVYKKKLILLCFFFLLFFFYPKIFTPFPPEAHILYAHIREVKKSERERV